MNARDWTTLVMRLVGLALITLSLLMLVGIILNKVLFPFASQFGPSVWSLTNWTAEIRLLLQAALGFYFLFGGKWVVKVLFRGLGGKEGYCPHCDYDVRGLASNRCPECGKRIRPDAE